MAGPGIASRDAGGASGVRGGLWLAGQVADHVGIGHTPAGTTATARFLLSPG
jgi:hypothetical protein